MTTTFDPMSPQAQAQQFYPAPGAVGIPAPQVDTYYQQPPMPPSQPAWSQGYQPYQGFAAQPSWTPTKPANNRNKLVAIIAAIVVVLAGGTVALIFALSGDKSTPAAPTVPVAPQQPPANYPQVPQVPSNGPLVPGQQVPSQGPQVPSQDPQQPSNGPIVPTDEPDQPAQPVTDGPGQTEAEQVAGSFVAALSSANFAEAQSYVCSAKAAGFADRAEQGMGSVVQLDTMALAGVTISGDEGEMTMTYRATGSDQTLHESLPLLVERGTWTVCN